MRFSLSVANTDDFNALKMKNIPNGVFSGAELSGAQLAGQELLCVLDSKGIIKVNVADIINHAVTRSLAHQSQNIIYDFKRQLNSMLENFPGRVDCVIVDFGLEDAMINSEFKERLIKLIKELALELEMLKCKLALPVRIPNFNNSFIEFCLDIKNTLMMPQVCFSVDVHPHELGKLFNPDELLRWLKFDIGTFRICYEPETGNRIVAKAIAPWVNFLKQTSFEGLVSFCPRCYSVDTLVNEAQNINDVISGLDKI